VCELLDAATAGGVMGQYLAITSSAALRHLNGVDMLQCESYGVPVFVSKPNTVKKSNTVLDDSKLVFLKRPPDMT
jgi:hypothetical protein